MIISKTPYRISFFGGGSDYPSWYLKNGGMDMKNTTYKGYGTSKQKYHDQRDRRIEFKLFESK